jgi:hypothetical protein
MEVYFCPVYTSRLDEVGAQNHARIALQLGKTARTHFTGGWVGPWDTLDECGEERTLPHWSSDREPSGQ